MSARPRYSARQRAQLATLEARLVAGELSFAAAWALRERLLAGEEVVPPTWPRWEGGVPPSLPDPYNAPPAAPSPRRTWSAPARAKGPRVSATERTLAALEAGARTAAEVAARLGTSGVTAHQHLVALLEAGRVTRERRPGHGRTFFYAVADAEPEPEPEELVPPDLARFEALEAGALRAFDEAVEHTSSSLATRLRVDRLEALGALERLTMRGELVASRPDGRPGVYRRPH